MLEGAGEAWRASAARPQAFLRSAHPSSARTYPSAASRASRLVVDEEPLAGELLCTQLAAHPGFRVAGECRNGVEALEVLRASRPDVVFLNVQMPELDGLGVVHRVGPSRMPPTVFVTAYDQLAVRAFEAGALDYLLKPFDDDRLARTLERVRQRRALPGAQDAQDAALAPPLLRLLEQLERERSYPERLVLREEGRATFLPVAEVDWVEAHGKGVRMHARGRTHRLRESITQLEVKLDPRHFVRVHRSALVHLARVREVQAWFHGDFVFVLADGTKVTSGRAYREGLQELVGRRL